LNTWGKNDDEVSGELVEFLHYMENTTDRAAAETGSERIQRIHKRVSEAKKSEAVGMKFMRELEERNAARAEGRAEGRAKGRADAVLELLASLGAVPKEVEKQIQHQKDEDVLMKWLLLAAKAVSIDDFIKKM